MGEHDALFCFLDGLQGWAKMELKRLGVYCINDCHHRVTYRVQEGVIEATR